MLYSNRLDLEYIQQDAEGILPFDPVTDFVTPDKRLMERVGEFKVLVEGLDDDNRELQAGYPELYELKRAELDKVEEDLNEVVSGLFAQMEVHRQSSNQDLSLSGGLGAMSGGVMGVMSLSGVAAGALGSSDGFVGAGITGVLAACMLAMNAPQIYRIWDANGDLGEALEEAKKARERFDTIKAEIENPDNRENLETA